MQGAAGEEPGAGAGDFEDQPVYQGGVEGRGEGEDALGVGCEGFCGGEAGVDLDVGFACQVGEDEGLQVQGEDVEG